MRSSSWLALAALLGLSSTTCSLLISGEAEPLPCSQEGQRGPPACDEGFSCLGGICQPEEGAGGSPPVDALPAGGVAGAADGGVGGG